jgi:hypothetical protein
MCERERETKNMKNLRKFGVSAKIQTGHLTNTSGTLTLRLTRFVLITCNSKVHTMIHNPCIPVLADVHVFHLKKKR